jgi:hypothetical protein
MTETDVAARNGQQVLKAIEPMQTLKRLNTKMRQLHEEIQTVCSIAWSRRIGCNARIYRQPYYAVCG